MRDKIFVQYLFMLAERGGRTNALGNIGIYYWSKKTWGRQKSKLFASKAPSIQTLTLIIHNIFHININHIINND